METVEGPTLMTRGTFHGFAVKLCQVFVSYQHIFMLVLNVGKSLANLGLYFVAKLHIVCKERLHCLASLS